VRPRTLLPLVDDLSAAIAKGEWRAGERLPTHRALAADRGLAASTVSLAYRELARRGLVVGETGRGTFVREEMRRPDPILAEPSGLWVDLALNVPILPDQARLLAAAIGPLLQSAAAFEQALRPVPVAGSPDARAATAAFLSQPGWRVNPSTVLFANTAKQAIAATLSAALPRGGRLGCDALTYPVLKTIAANLGAELVPLEQDAAGTTARSIVAAHARRSLHGVYLQPVLQNPLGMTMPAERRREIAQVLRRLDIWALEDASYSFLAPTLTRLGREAPERVIVVDSFSKRLAPGLSVGVIVAPADRVSKITGAIRSAAAGPGGLALAACTRWMLEGTAAALAAAKRKDAAERQKLLRRVLKDARVQSDPRSYHAWLTLPKPWRAEAFEAAAADEGIAVVRASAFTVRAGTEPQAVRLALASPTMETLSTALQRLAHLAASEPQRRR
jgi:DNA-binding transcriptional MocR family regulator